MLIFLHLIENLQTHSHLCNLLCVTHDSMCYVAGCSKLTSKYLYTLFRLWIPTGFVLESLFRHIFYS